MSLDCHSFRVIYENEDLVVVNKPHDVPMDGDEHPVTVERWALSHRANTSSDNNNNNNNNKNNGNLSSKESGAPTDGKKKVKFVHQLDYATSGVLCVAFSREMAARLSHCFEMRTTQKAYLAILRGIIPPLSKENCNSEKNSISAGVQMHRELPYSNAVRVVRVDELPNADFIRRCVNDANDNNNKEKKKKDIHNTHSSEKNRNDDISLSSSSSFHLLAIDLPVGYDDSDPGGFRMAVNGRDARESLTYMYILQRGYIQHPTEKCTVVPVTKVILIPRTGRRHQLRVHCHALGFPILGDVTYDAVSSPQIVEMIRTTTTTKEKEKEKEEEVIEGGNAAVVREYGSEIMESNVGINANTWERMMLHAWRLSFPVSVELLRCGIERYMQKRKRRRVRLGLEAAEDKEGPAEWTHFKTEDPFKDYISESP
ncbi:pseudouridylate synthase [Trypanosoma theileri]|uniref:Pseudouridylate synthase n=1 Tax=Trypanosoma theileri TaxID=67003 RepID=A0A1X0P244_9TRYP|nr:pseudouridylate synthase [Trypanosoma theileri]ORC90921.1 pseudouridylate synthase [Trypanosoma theileri]